MTQRDYNKEAREVKGFDTSVIKAMTEEEKAYLEDYNRRVSDDNLLNNPTANENLKYFSHQMLFNANHFKSVAENIEGDGEMSKRMRKNFEDVAEANWNAYIDIIERD